MTYVRETFVSLNAHQVAHIEATVAKNVEAVNLEVTDDNGRRVVSLSLFMPNLEISRELADAINAVFVRRSVKVLEAAE